MARPPLLPTVLAWLLLTGPGLAAPAQATVIAGAPPPAAATQTGAGEAAGESAPVLPGAGRLQPFHQYFSESVEALSWKIDSFFGATRVYEEYAGNYLQMSGSVIYGRAGALDFDGRLRLKLDLPNLEERINLIFESQEEGPTQDERITSGTPLKGVREGKNLRASLQWVVQQQPRWDVRVQPGLKLRLDPQPFLRLRMRWREPFSTTWLTRTTLTPGWYADRGWEARGRFDLERGTGAGGFFRSSSETVWLYDDARNLQLLQSFLFTHPLNGRTRLAYEAGVAWELDPRFRDTGYFVSSRYRRNIHRGWMFLELKPQVVFEREEDFATDVSFAVTLEMLFGGEFL